MKRLVMFVLISIFLMSFIIAGATITTSAIDNSSGIQNQIQANINTENQVDASKIKVRTRVQNRLEDAFCGTSTLGACESDEDCITAGCSNAVCQSKNEEPIVTTCEYRECYNAETYNAKCLCKKNKCIWNKLTQNQIKNVITARNRIKAEVQAGECPGNCTCTGSVTKCQLANGTREMTVVAGKSGNIIVQVKGINASTKVVLYKSEDGKVYGVFRNNETKRVRLLPDQVRERIRERLARQLEDENITLNEDGDYEYKAQKKAKLFFMFPVRVTIKAELDPETGEIIKLRNSWWTFLAKDEGEQIVGAGCGTVTPGMNDECCQNKGYDLWNSETSECEFSDEEE